MSSHSCTPRAWHGDDHHRHNCTAKHSTVELALQQPACQHEKSTHRQQCQPKSGQALNRHRRSAGAEQATCQDSCITLSLWLPSPVEMTYVAHVSHSMSASARSCAHSVVFLPQVVGLCQAVTYLEILAKFLIMSAPCTQEVGRSARS